MKNFSKGFVIILSLTYFNACSKTSGSTATDGTEASSNVSESAMSEAGQHATSSEGAASPSLMFHDELAEDVKSMDYVDPTDTVHPASACSFSTARSTCSANADTITWNNCSVGLASLTGGWTETWSAGFCANGAMPGALINGTSVTRTSTSQVLTLASGATLTTDTNAHTTYNGTALPATGITVSMASGTRTVNVNGIHKVMIGPIGRTWFNHSITGNLNVTGSRATGNRVINGTSTLYHNLALYQAAHTFNSATWGSSTCCYPTSGSISSVLTGSRTGNTSLTFSATCGQATFVDTDSSSSSVTLTHCN